MLVVSTVSLLTIHSSLRRSGTALDTLRNTDISVNTQKYVKSADGKVEGKIVNITVRSTATSTFERHPEDYWTRFNILT
jgi:ribonuclease PH